MHLVKEISRLGHLRREKAALLVQYPGYRLKNVRLNCEHPTL